MSSVLWKYFESFLCVLRYEWKYSPGLCKETNRRTGSEADIAKGRQLQQVLDDIGEQLSQINPKNNLRLAFSHMSNYIFLII